MIPNHLEQGKDLKKEQRINLTVTCGIQFTLAVLKEPCIPTDMESV